MPDPSWQTDNGMRHDDLGWQDKAYGDPAHRSVEIQASRPSSAAVEDLEYEYPIKILTKDVLD